MEFSGVLNSVLATLQKENIPVCVVGEVALNYYNVPRVVHVSLWQSFMGLLFLTEV